MPSLPLGFISLNKPGLKLHQVMVKIDTIIMVQDSSAQINNSTITLTGNHEILVGQDASTVMEFMAEERIRMEKANA